MPIISGQGSAGSSLTTYRKTTAKQVLNTVTEIDLLNGEITLAAGVLGTTKVAKIDLWGDWVQNTGGNSQVPTLKLKLGATTLIAWQTSTFNVTSSATRYAWQYSALIAAQNATNAQTCSLTGYMTSACAAATATQDNVLTTGEGVQSGVLGVNGHGMAQVSAYNSATVDTTQAQALTFTTTNASSTATYDVTLRGALVVIF